MSMFPVQKVTFYDDMMKRLQENALSKNDASSVMTEIVNDKDFALGTMVDRWGDDISSYPENAINILWLNVKQSAYEWIKQNCPQAWFLPMFMPTEELKIHLIENGRKDLADSI